MLRFTLAALAASQFVSSVYASPLGPSTGAGAGSRDPQLPLKSHKIATQPNPKKLKGKFLQITDIHPDPFYEVGSDVEQRCHRGQGNAGVFGAEAADCDTPFSLVDETFKWIKENIKDEIDFVIWTGDSARHDNDVNLPRSEKQIFDLNQQMVNKMIEVFGKSENLGDDDPTNDLLVPIVPTLGNNDIMPHNIMMAGPNSATRAYRTIWDKFIPQDQYNVFDKGGYFWQQVIPGTNGKIGAESEGGLAVVSLNTLYFFMSNTAVDGCDIKGEPGYEQMDWLRVQLEFMRERGMKAILIGHVPPAWTSTKQSWDETCWRKYVHWSTQYRDVITGGLYGHMNLDHFMLHDSEELKPGNDKHKKQKNKKGKKQGKKSHKQDENGSHSMLTSLNNIFASNAPEPVCTEEFDEENPAYTVSSAETYLNSLRELFARVPTPEEVAQPTGKGKKNKDKAGYVSKIGGQWGERYTLTHVSPSIVPNYFPTLRVFEYNTTGYEHTVSEVPQSTKELMWEEFSAEDEEIDSGKDPIPEPPSKSTPPGPAYSMQPLTLIGYTQYFANLTRINGRSDEPTPQKHLELRDDSSAEDREFRFEVEYDTKSDKVYKLKDLTVRNYIKLARWIVDASSAKKKKKTMELSESEEDGEWDLTYTGDEEVEENVEADKKKKDSEDRAAAKDRIWHAFVKRAFVQTVNEETLQRFDARRTCSELDSPF
ncbi:Endopolyphosphatase [Rhizina undulata]